MVNDAHRHHPGVGFYLHRFTQPFTFYGLGSVQAVSLTGDLESSWGRTLSPTLAWDYPTIELLANYLANDPHQSKPQVHPPLESAIFKIHERTIAIIWLELSLPAGIESAGVLELLRTELMPLAKSRLIAGIWRTSIHQPRHPGESHFTLGGVLMMWICSTRISFGISPRERPRAWIPTAPPSGSEWEALENSLSRPQSLAGLARAWFVGISSYDYSACQFDDPEMIDAYAGTGQCS